MLSLMTVFLGCGFAAKYREGGGNFSVPLQWMLGLRRLRQDAIWLEILPATNDHARDAACIANFQRQLRAHGLAGRYCLLYQDPAREEHDLAAIRCIGLSRGSCASGWLGRMFSSTFPTRCIRRFSSSSSGGFSAISIPAKSCIG